MKQLCLISSNNLESSCRDEIKQNTPEQRSNQSKSKKGPYKHQTRVIYFRFTAVFCNVAAWSLVEIYRRSFLMMEAVITSETLSTR